MPRPIDADRLYNEILSKNISVSGKQIFHPTVKQSVLDSIEMSDTLDYEPVRYGEWIPQDGTFTLFMCSVCEGRNSKIEYKYCPNCGALMDGKEDAHG